MKVFLIIGIILFVLWLAGLIGSFTLGGLLHILLVIALILIILNLLGIGV